MELERIEQQLSAILQEIEDNKTQYIQRERELQHRESELRALKNKVISAPRETEIARANLTFLTTGKLPLTGVSFEVFGEQDSETSTLYSYGRLKIGTTYLQNPHRIQVKISVRDKFSVTIHIRKELEDVVKVHGAVTCVYPIFMESIREGSHVWIPIKCIAVHTVDGTCHIFCVEKQRKTMPRYLGYVETLTSSITELTADKYTRAWISKRTGVNTKIHMPLLCGSS